MPKGSPLRAAPDAHHLLRLSCDCPEIILTHDASYSRLHYSPGNPYLNTSVATCEPITGPATGPIFPDTIKASLPCNGAGLEPTAGALPTGTGVGTATAVGAGLRGCCGLLRKSDAAPTPTARPTAKMPPWTTGLPGMTRTRRGNADAVATRDEKIVQHDDPLVAPSFRQHVT